MGVNQSAVEKAAEPLAPAPDCCPPGSEPLGAPPADYVNRGETRLIGETNVYVSVPPPEPVSLEAESSRNNLLDEEKKQDPQSATRKVGVIVIQDAFGYYTGRHCYFADEVASLGYTVLIPDVYRGSPPWTKTEGFGLLMGTPAALYKLNTKFNFTKVYPDIQTTMEYAEANLGVQEWAAVGFCYGGYIITHLAGTGKFKCVASAHPSLQIFFVTGEDKEAAVKNMKCPAMYLPAGNDPDDAKPGGFVQETLKKIDNPQLLANCVFHSFPEMTHGWTIRGDLSNTAVLRDSQEALKMFIKFLEKHAPLRDAVSSSS